MRAPGSLWRAFGAAPAATVLCGVLIVAVALDGAICVLMALPLALPLALAGAYVGWLARRGASRPPRTFALALVALPLAMGAEAKVDRPPAHHAVTTSVIVDAPPEAVWRRVVAFPPLPEPRSLHFRAGIAYPRSATISGRGVGAVRRCRFSTGDFVEPITVWDEPRRLAFSVTEQPAPMRELSFWGEVHPPHLDGFLRSRRGEFRLIPLPGGRTLLRGTTWYENRMWPAPYWRLWSDEIIGSIHERVLAHVARWAEADHRRNVSMRGEHEPARNPEPGSGAAALPPGAHRAVGGPRAPRRAPLDRRVGPRPAVHAGDRHAPEREHGVRGAGDDPRRLHRPLPP